jgi:hypothetical protein
MRQNIRLLLIFLAMLTGGTSTAVAQAATTDLKEVKAGKGEECTCRNMQASSLPAVSTDVCTRNETAGSCQLVWNAGSRSSGPIGPFNQAFGDALTFARSTPGFNPPVLSSACANSPDPSCPYIEYLRRNSYEDDPDNAAIAFIGLASAAWAAARNSALSQAVLTELRQPDERRQLGQALSRRMLLTRTRGQYTLRAVLGCLQIRAAGATGATVEIQNQASRNENSCPQ